MRASDFIKAHGGAWPAGPAKRKSFVAGERGTGHYSRPIGYTRREKAAMFPPVPRRAVDAAEMGIHASCKYAAERTGCRLACELMYHKRGIACPDTFERSVHLRRYPNKCPHRGELRRLRYAMLDENEGERVGPMLGPKDKPE